MWYGLHFILVFIPTNTNEWRAGPCLIAYTISIALLQYLWFAESQRDIMAGFLSSNTNILSPSSHRHLSLLPNTHSQFQFHKQNCNFSSTSRRVSAAPTTGTADLHVYDSSPASVATRWAEFAEKVSGEWDGFGADFTAEGQPVELPESVVPEAYREWEVKVFDWQTQCPTLADNSPSPSLSYRSIKLLPTVGCEADAATIYSVDERTISAPRDSAFAYLSTGCYVAEWRSDSALELEHCLIDPTNRESRVRVIQVLELRESELKLKKIKVFVEQWYGPFRNGDQLGGCSIRDSAFAATERLKASRVAGVWQGLTAVAKFNTHQDMIRQLGDERASKSIRDEGDLILLPKQLWCSVKRGNDCDGTCCEIGWLLDEGRAITSKCIFSSTAQLKEIAISNETATPI